jgi:hypothetical protein
MIKRIIAFAFSIAIMAPAALASERSDCLKAAKETLKADLMACKEKTGMDKKDCKKEAHKKAKEAREACKSKPK